HPPHRGRSPRVPVPPGRRGAAGRHRAGGHRRHRAPDLRAGPAPRRGRPGRRDAMKVWLHGGPYDGAVFEAPEIIDQLVLATRGPDRMVYHAYGHQDCPFEVDSLIPYGVRLTYEGSRAEAPARCRDRTL